MPSTFAASNGARVGVAVARNPEGHLLAPQLATGNDAWEYKQRLVGLFESPDFWASIPNMILFDKFGEQHQCFLKDMIAKANITFEIYRGHCLTNASSQ